MQFVYNSYVLTVNQYIDAIVTTNICCTLDTIRIHDILSLCYISTIIVDYLWYKTYLYSLSLIGSIQSSQRKYTYMGFSLIYPQSTW